MTRLRFGSTNLLALSQPAHTSDMDSMGAGSVKPYDNDDAMDWLDELEDIDGDDARLDHALAAFAAVYEDPDYVEVDRAGAAIAAAAWLAAIPIPDHCLTPGVQLPPPTITNGHVRQAIAALALASGRDAESEWADQWLPADLVDGLAEVDAIIEALRQRAPEPATSRIGDLAGTHTPPLVRTDYTDDTAWERVIAATLAPGKEELEGYVPEIAPLTDRRFDGATPEDVLSSTPEEPDYNFVLIADHRSMTDPEMTVIVMDLCFQPGRTFRTTMTEVAGIEANLNIANMDFHEFADDVAEDGTFRGFE